MTASLRDRLRKLVYANRLSLAFFARMSRYLERVARERSPIRVDPGPEPSLSVIVPSYNNVAYCERNLNSIFEQRYHSWRMVYIDDASTDGTGERVRRIIDEKGQGDRVQLVINRENRGAMANLYHAIHACPDDDIILTVDGDDWLGHEHVMATVAEQYRSARAWMTYGQFIYYPSFMHGFCSPLPRGAFVRRRGQTGLRKAAWIASHLRTFYAGLFKRIRPDDLMLDGEFARVSWDVAMMLPMLEMAQERARFVPSVLYVYNSEQPLNDHRVRRAEQEASELRFRALPSYHRLETL